MYACTSRGNLYIFKIINKICITYKVYSDNLINKTYAYVILIQDTTESMYKSYKHKLTPINLKIIKNK